MPGMIGVTYILAKHYRSYNPGRLHCGAAFKAFDAGKASGPSTTGLDKPFATWVVKLWPISCQIFHCKPSLWERIGIRTSQQRSKVYLPSWSLPPTRLCQVRAMGCRNLPFWSLDLLTFRRHFCLLSWCICSFHHVLPSQAPKPSRLDFPKASGSELVNIRHIRCTDFPAPLALYKAPAHTAAHCNNLWPCLPTQNLRKRQGHGCHWTCQWTVLFNVWEKATSATGFAANEAM